MKAQPGQRQGLQKSQKNSTHTISLWFNLYNQPFIQPRSISTKQPKDSLNKARNDSALGERQVATGEVFLGADAKSKGLVDRLATSDEAANSACRCFEGSGQPALSAGLAVETAERTKISVGRLAKELYTEAFSGASFGTGRCDSDLGPELRPMSGLSEGRTPELFNPAGPRDQFVA